MARRIPENRFDELVRCATDVFIARGYRLTQMSDIAREVGVAKGTLYGYVESKESLFVLCLRSADIVEPIDVPEILPVATPAFGETLTWVKARLAEELSWPALLGAIQLDRAPDIRAELALIIGEFYDLLYANKCRIKLLDSSADHAELGRLWQTEGREQPRLAFLRYLESRIASGQIRELPDLPLATRMMIETCTTWAVHIHWDRNPETFDPASARANAIDFLVMGFVA